MQPPGKSRINDNYRPVNPKYRGSRSPRIDRNGPRTPDSPLRNTVVGNEGQNRNGGNFNQGRQLYNPPPHGVGDVARKTTRSATDLDRDAKAAFNELKEALKTQPPWAKDIEYHRQKCRNLHQTLLLNHPLSPLSRSLDSLWIQSSYTLIAAYRDLVSRTETPSNIHQSPAQLQGPGNTAKRVNQNRQLDQQQNEELRKVLTRFKQVLSSEESFYRQLILRFVKYHRLQSLVQDVLERVELSVITKKYEHIIERDYDDFNRNPSTEPFKKDGSDKAENSELQKELSGEEKKDKLNLIYKALICLGDIERYKEQYSDAYRKEKAFKAKNTPKMGVEVEERFEKAKGYYDAARALIPDDGSAYNQLAVISTYRSDDFSTIYYYIRALAVKVPFKGVSDILDKYLKKFYEKWNEVEDTASSGGNVEKFKLELGVLVAIIYRQNGFSNIASLRTTLSATLINLIRSRTLPSESIVKLTSIIIGLHWTSRQTASSRPIPANLDPNSSGGKKSIRLQQSESISLGLLLDVFTVIMDVAAGEVEQVMNYQGWVNPLENAIDTDNDDDQPGGGIKDEELSKNISAVFRRLLPSLRIISKWLKLHLPYISKYTSTPPIQPSGGGNIGGKVEDNVNGFWSQYYRLIECLAKCFPLGMLPHLKAGGLEEDEDLRGFLPISRGLANKVIVAKYKETDNDAEVDGQYGGVLGGGNGDVGVRTHPNEEQLMRIGDLQVDATLILQAQTTGNPIHDYNDAPISSVPARTSTEIDIQSNTDTEEDPVNLAMRTGLSFNDQHDESGLGFTYESIYGDNYDDNDPNFNFDKSPWMSMNNSHNITSQPSTGLEKPTAFDLLQNLVIDKPTSGPQNTVPQSERVPSFSSPALGSTKTFAGVAASSPQPPAFPRTSSGNQQQSTQFVPPQQFGVKPGTGAGAGTGTVNPSSSMLFGNNDIWSMTREESASGGGLKRNTSGSQHQPQRSSPSLQQVQGSQPPQVRQFAGSQGDQLPNLGVIGSGMNPQNNMNSPGRGSGGINLSRPVSDTAKQRTQDQVKALWNDPIQPIQPPLSTSVGPIGSTQNGPLPPSRGLDAAQLFAGISSGSPWAIPAQHRGNQQNQQNQKSTYGDYQSTYAQGGGNNVWGGNGNLGSGTNYHKS